MTKSERLRCQVEQRCIPVAYPRSAPRNTAGSRQMEERTKGRAVFEGSFASDQDSNDTVFDELASPASLMPAAKMIYIIGCQQGMDRT